MTGYKLLIYSINIFKERLQWCMASQAIYMHLPRNTVDKLWHELVGHTLSKAKLSLPLYESLFRSQAIILFGFERVWLYQIKHEWCLLHVLGNSISCFLCTCTNFTPLVKIFTQWLQQCTHCVTQPSCTGFTVLGMEGSAFYIYAYVVWHKVLEVNMGLRKREKWPDPGNVLWCLH